jgi:hypothetical protein
LKNPKTGEVGLEEFRAGIRFILGEYIKPAVEAFKRHHKN